jgi:hypothetical protein
MVVKILLITDSVLHETRLPNPSAPLPLVAPRYPEFLPAGAKPLGRESRFNRPPAARIVRVAHRQRPHHVQVIGQKDNRDRREWRLLAFLPHYPAQA